MRRFANLRIFCGKILLVMSVTKTKNSQNKKRIVMSRLTTVEKQGDRSFDIEFWQKLNDEQRMQAVWDLVVFDYELKGKNLDELRLQRTVENLCRQKG
ncbi:hypothetical protein BH20ACI4_BH20ACI4_27420 [soil metagenome]